MGKKLDKRIAECYNAAVEVAEGKIDLVATDLRDEITQSAEDTDTVLRGLINNSIDALEERLTVKITALDSRLSILEQIAYMPESMPTMADDQGETKLVNSLVAKELADCHKILDSQKLPYPGSLADRLKLLIADLERKRSLFTVWMQTSQRHVCMVTGCGYPAISSTDPYADDFCDTHTKAKAAQDGQ